MPGRMVVKGVNRAASVGHAASRRRPVDPGVAAVAGVVVAAAVLRPVLERLLDRPAVAHWATVFVDWNDLADAIHVDVRLSGG